MLSTERVDIPDMHLEQRWMGLGNASIGDYRIQPSRKLIVLALPALERDMKSRAATVERQSVRIDGPSSCRHAASCEFAGGDDD